MIEFNGQPTGKCKLYVQKRESKMGTLAATFSVCLIGIPVIIMLFVLTTLDSWWILGLIIPTMIIIVALFALAPFIKSNESTILPSKITIYDDGRMESQSEKFHWVQRVDEVKQVIDWGDWYQIIFIPSSKNLRYICQKNLLTKGTLNDFENLFQGKITRRN